MVKAGRPLLVAALPSYGVVAADGLGGVAVSAAPFFRFCGSSFSAAAAPQSVEEFHVTDVTDDDTIGHDKTAR